MEKKGELIEFIIKLVYFIFSMIAFVFIVKNVITMFPLYRIYQYDEQEIYNAIYKTSFGPIVENMGVIEVIDSSMILNIILAFIKNLNWLEVVFLVLTMIMTFVFFLFIKWHFIETYLKLTGYLLFTYLGKYLFFALSILFFYKNDIASFSFSIIIGTSLYLILSIIELFIISLFIIKFILNLRMDLKIIYSH